MKIMVVEDSAVDQRKISGFLQQWNLDFTVTTSGAEAWRLLQERNAPRLVLLDWMLPEIDGIELCRKIRTLSANGNYFYTVMLTVKDRKTDLLTAMAAGADDYLTKPVNASELRARLLVGKRILELQESLRFAATHDFLSKVLNRAEILACLRREVSRGERERKTATIILADIDHFKGVNDTLGHAAGDVVLQEVARRLQSDLRSYDLVGRYGGEEFLLILPNCSLAIGKRRADEIRGLLSSQPVITTFARVPVTVSMGVTATDYAKPLTIEDLLHQADCALYCAKKRGRNRVEAFALEEEPRVESYLPGVPNVTHARHKYTPGRSSAVSTSLSYAAAPKTKR